MNLWEAKQSLFESTVRQLTAQKWQGTVNLSTVDDLTPELLEWYLGVKETLQENFRSFLASFPVQELAPDEKCVAFRDMCDLPRSRLKCLVLRGPSCSAWYGLSHGRYSH